MNPESAHARHAKTAARPTPLLAWGDESVRMAASEPTYLLAATVLGEGSRDAIDRLLSLKPKSAAKLHWRDMGLSAQRKSLEIMSVLEHSTTVVAAAPVDGKRQERARRKCLQALLPLLERDGVRTLTLESRGTDLDKKDVDFLFWMRRSGHLSEIDLRHAAGALEPRLCIPDQVLGAYGDVIAGGKGVSKWSEAWAHVREGVRVLEIGV